LAVILHASYKAAMGWLLLQSLVVGLASAAATGVALRLLRRRAILDHPNERSSHDRPTPRGGGIAVVLVVAVAWGWSEVLDTQRDILVVLTCAIALAALSWIDDLRSLPPWLRLLGQGLAVAAAMPWLMDHGPVFQGLLPGWLDAALAGLAWVWFVNLFNFMDGIDGIAGVETAGIGLGLVAVGLLAPAGALDPWPALSLAAAALGFLWWNWQPAKVFLGDVGSIPIGFLLGWLLLTAAANGFWAPALILPLYYLTDATATLLRRAARGEKVWRAHREHAYQYAVQQGRSHAAVSGAIAVANIALIGLALAAMHAPLPALGGAVAIVVLLLVWMRR
jgi:UDP-N-acetylmuramyl pentapeptide phosphotransferase/UDP-N-acetylglucosamine-1-phosphate transferase